MKEHHWTKKTTEAFIELGMLSDDESFILRSRVKGMSVSQQAMELNVSESTVARLISKMKKKYDIVQKEYPELFPVRRKSAKEKWMDTH